MSYILLLSTFFTYKRFLALWALFGMLVSHSWFTHNFQFGLQLEIVLGTIGFFAFLFSLLINKSAFHFKNSRYVALIILYFLMAAVSGIINGSTWLWGHLILLAVPMGFGLSFIYAFSRNDLRKLIYILSLFGFVEVLFAFILFGLDVCGIETPFPQSGFITDRNGFGRYLSIINSFFLIEFLLEKRKPRKRFYLMAMISIFLGILIQYSRSGYIVYFVSSSVIIFLLGSKREKRIACMILPVILALFTAFTIARIRSDKMLIANYSDLGRVYLFKSGMNMVRAHPIKGIGYQMTPSLFREYADKSLPGLPFVVTIHNWFLAVWAEMGLIGLIAFCGLNFGLMYHLLKRFFAAGFLEGKYSFFSFIALLILMIDCLFLPNYDYESIYWIIIAIAIISLQGNASPDAPNNPKRLAETYA